jgi:hypothetical protein
MVGALFYSQRMGSQRYGKYGITSRPHLDPVRGVWLSYASVTWQDENGMHYYQFNNEKTFDNEEEALAFGFIVARAFADDNV